MEIGTKVKITKGACKNMVGHVTEIFTWDHETELLLADSFTFITINSEYVEAL